MLVSRELRRVSYLLPEDADCDSDVIEGTAMGIAGGSIGDDTRRGWYLPAGRGVENHWVGGRHINLYPPGGGTDIHIPISEGYDPTMFL